MDDITTSEDTLVLTSGNMVEIPLTTDHNPTPEQAWVDSPNAELFEAFTPLPPGVFTEAPYPFFDLPSYKLADGKVANGVYLDWMADSYTEGRISSEQYQDRCEELFLHNATNIETLALLSGHGNSYRSILSSAARNLIDAHNIGLPLAVLTEVRGPGFLDADISRLRAMYSPDVPFVDMEAVRDYLRGAHALYDCDDCGRIDLVSHTRTTHNGDDVCRACIDSNYTYVVRYGEYVHNDNLFRNALDEDGCVVTISSQDSDFEFDQRRDRYVHVDYSDSSDDDEDEEDEDEEDDSTGYIIRDYHSSKGRFSPQHDDWTRTNKRFLGVELEVEVKGGDRHNSAKIIHDHVNSDGVGSPVFFEADGSLDCGFEMITQPMSLPAQRELWEFLKDPGLVRGLRSHDTSTCGLHVHVSRAGMSSLQIAKVVAFVNSDDNEQLIRAIARRHSSHYCRIIKKKLGACAKGDSRYEAVNISPPRTIEFRIFRGTLKYEAVIAAIEFANAVVAFCRTAETSIQDLTTPKFMAYINTKLPKETTILRPYLANRLDGE